MTATATLARRLARPGLTALALAVAVAGAGCGGSPAAPAAAGGRPCAGTVTISAKSLPRVGTVLVNAAGDALYMFVPDDQRQVTCVSLCAETWPPVRLRTGAALAAGPGVRQALLGSDADPAGGRVVTYHGWPLYSYTADVYAGQTTGQGIDLNGGYWYLVRPDGQVVRAQLQ